MKHRGHSGDSTPSNGLVATKQFTFTWSRHFQMIVCLLVWCSAVFYSIYRVSKSAFDLSEQLSDDDFEAGWPFLSNWNKDISDYEWNFFTAFVPKFAPWILLHIVISNCIKRICPRLLPCFYVTFSLASISEEIGFAATGFILFQLILMYIVHLNKRKWICWAFSLALLCVLNLEANASFKSYLVEPDTKAEFALAIIIAWVNCRVLSFCMIKCDEPLAIKSSSSCIKDQNNNELLVLLAYCLYFPVLFFGPLIMYDDFVRDLFQPPMRLSTRIIVAWLGRLFRYTFWFLFAEFALHFFHGSALHYQSYLVTHLPLWSLCGLGFGMSQFFMVKYTVLYGLSSTLAKAEGFDAPPPPKCIAHIHLYSDMWKYFDFGLYTFLKRFIYIPLVGNDGRDNLARKLFARFSCFAFIYVWHGATSNVLMWTALNFIGVTLESFAHICARTTVYEKITLVIGSTASGHVKAILVAPLLAMSAISNFYFICGGDVGDIFIRRLVINGKVFHRIYSLPVRAGSLVPTVAIWTVLVSMCHVSEEIRRWELSRRVKSGTSLRRSE